MSKSVIISTETPNDQGGIIPNHTFDFSRFSKNPIMLYGHNWDEIIGHWDNVRLEAGGWVADPIFSDIPEAKKYKSLFEEGNLKSASIGALVVWESDYSGEPKKNKDGYKVASKTILYEVSLVPIPSNENAVTLYTEAELTTLNSKFMAKKVNEETPETTEQVVEEVNPQGETHVILEGFKNFVAEIKNMFTTLAPAHTEPDGDEPVGKGSLDNDMPQGAQLESEAEMEAEPEEGKEAEKEEYCNKEAEMEAGLKLPPVIEKVINESKINTDMPEIKTAEELAALKTAPAPTAPVVVFKSGATFTQLNSEKEGKQIIDRVLSCGGKTKHVNEHAIVLNAILADPRFKAVVEKFSARTENTAKMGAQEIAARLSSGTPMPGYTQLSTSDDALATPDTLAVEWLSLFLFKLFPSTSWKSKIPVFGATEAGKNLGLIWTNIAADPLVYKGSKPSTPANYEYSDTAVSMKLINFWLQPMLWTPLTMHMLRYDQMGTGWNQALMKFNTEIDDQLIYTLASLVPAASIVKTNGGAFTIASSSDVNSFVLNPAFTGSLAKPLLNNIIQIQQLFDKQNFEAKKFQVAMDPTMDSYISQDPETKSLLTRWVDADSGSEMLGFKRGEFAVRSKVALYDPATSAVIDPSGVIPATAVSAAYAFIPDQIGIGIGQLDVFMIQDPTNYGYKMSADVRMGATNLRKNGYGTALYTYGEPQN